jgi:hypothetical protein
MGFGCYGAVPIHWFGTFLATAFVSAAGIVIECIESASNQGLPQQERAGLQVQLLPCAVGRHIVFRISGTSGGFEGTAAREL